MDTIDELAAHAARGLERLRALSGQLSSITANAASADGDVVVTVDGSGALVDLVLSPRIGGLTPARFERILIDTALAAAAQAFARRAELVDAFNAETAGSLAVAEASVDER